MAFVYYVFYWIIGSLIYNQLGQLVVSNHYQANIGISSLSQGIYFLKIKDENDAFATQKVVKK